jgi:DNA-directed RNA polymerase subunit L
MVDDGSNTAVIGVVGCTSALVNCIRRTVMADVPCVACPGMDADGFVTVHVNTSRLCNEVLAERLSLVPIHVNDAEMIDWSATHGGSNGPYKFLIKAKAPSDSTQSRKVTSKDIVVMDSRSSNVVDTRTRDRLFPADKRSGDHILIIELFPNEEVNIEFKARVGCGREHSRWNPTSRSTHVVRIDPAAYDAALAAKLDSVTDPEKIKLIKAQFAVGEGQRCFGKDQNAFDLTICSEVGTSPIKLFATAVDIILGRVRDFKLNLERLSGSNEPASEATKVRLQSNDDYHSLTVHGENDTLGNFVQDRLYHHWIVSDNMRTVKFIGYSMPHPLEKTIVFKWKTADHGNKAIDTFIGALQTSVIEYLEAFKENLAP